jgi:hypothetical protein
MFHFPYVGTKMKNSQLKFFSIITHLEVRKFLNRPNIVLLNTDRRFSFERPVFLLWNNPQATAFIYLLNQDIFMKSLTFVFPAVLCVAAFPVLAGAVAAPNNFITLAQADVTIGPNGIGIGERGRYRARERDYDRFDRDHDRDRVRLRGYGDRGCRTVTVQEGGETRTTRRCD